MSQADDTCCAIVDQQASVKDIAPHEAIDSLRPQMSNNNRYCTDDKRTIRRVAGHDKGSIILIDENCVPSGRGRVHADGADKGKLKRRNQVWIDRRQCRAGINEEAANSQIRDRETLILQEFSARQAHANGDANNWAVGQSLTR